ncbi:unnamed protein product [Rhizoctonia solani]|uniref:RRM domain-containing protein n=1 Tax=Rhizoctonia solani TaxID=456999 RepID=A0A8H3H3E7_9AGAM|nr:unnamed protein product [Rhizoctonia solani]
MPPRAPPASRATASPTASLYITELDSGVSEAMLFEIFNIIGPVASVRVFRDTVIRRSLGYAYVAYTNTADGDRTCIGPTELLDYQESSLRDPALHKTGQGGIFIRNLDEAIDNQALHDAFTAFGNILSCKVATDENDKSRGYGYVDYETAESAEVAIKAANRMLLNGKQVFVNPNISRKERQSKYAGGNLHVKNLDADVDDDKLCAEFEAFGTITSCKVMRNERGRSKGFGFVCFSTPEEANKAVAEMSNKIIGSKPIYIYLTQPPVPRQQLEGQSVQHNQVHLQQPPTSGPGYIEPQTHYGTGLGRYPPQAGRDVTGTRYPRPSTMPHSRHPSEQPMPGSPTPVVHERGALSEDNPLQDYGRGTAPSAPPRAPRSGGISIPPLPAHIGSSPIDNYLCAKTWDNDTDGDEFRASRISSPAEESMNNQNTPPDFGDSLVTSTHPKDEIYYQPNRSGVFLVDGVLFENNVRLSLFTLLRNNKVQATAIFGSRLGVTPKSNKKFSPMYLEDILPRLSESSDSSPIELLGITKKQFRTYLLLITGLPYDKAYLSLLMDYSIPENHSQDLFLRYLDIVAVAPRLGMIKLEEWAINALQTMLTKLGHSFYQISHNWNYAGLVQLRELTRNTNLDSPVRAFIQYLIYRIAQNIRRNQSTGSGSSKTADLAELYQGFKNSNDDNALLGCVFLNVLSLGHRSQVWSHLTRDDKAILYAAQALLTDLSREFASGSLARASQ